MASLRYLALVAFMCCGLGDDDCNDFKMKCQSACIAQSNGVATNQCWGSPRFRLCRCSDNGILKLSGYDCEHPTCPDEARTGAPTAPAANLPGANTPTVSSSSSSSQGKCVRCDNKKSVGGFTSWVVGTSSDGTTVRTAGKPEGNPIMCANDHSYYAYSKFSMAGSASYATIDVALGNKAEGPNVLPSTNSQNISASTGLTVVYASDKDIYLQIRHGANKHGGHHYRVLLPKQLQKDRHFQFQQFAQPSWVPGNEKYELDLSDVFSFTFVAVQSGALLVSDLSVEFPKLVNAPVVPTCNQLLYDQSECVGADCTLPVPKVGNAPVVNPTSAPLGVDYVLLAAKQAVALENAQYGKQYKMVAVLEGKELHTVGYNYPLKLLVSTSETQMVVETIVATTTYRDQYRSD